MKKAKDIAELIEGLMVAHKTIPNPNSHKSRARRKEIKELVEGLRIAYSLQRGERSGMRYTPFTKLITKDFYDKYLSDKSRDEKNGIIIKEVNEEAGKKFPDWKFEIQTSRFYIYSQDVSKDYSKPPDKKPSYWDGKIQASTNILFQGFFMLNVFNYDMKYKGKEIGMSSKIPEKLGGATKGGKMDAFVNRLTHQLTAKYLNKEFEDYYYFHLVTEDNKDEIAEFDDEIRDLKSKIRKGEGKAGVSKYKEELEDAIKDKKLTESVKYKIFFSVKPDVREMQKKY